MLRRTCTVPTCLAGETHLFVLLVSLLGCSAVKNNKGCPVFCEAAFPSQQATYSVRRDARSWCGGQGSVIRNWRSQLGTPLQPARLHQVYKKHMSALTAPPAWAKSAQGLATAIESEAQALHLEKKKKVQTLEFWLLTQSAVLIIFFQNFTHSWCIKNGQTVTLCSITPSESPQFKLPKPQKLQNASQSVHVDIHTVPWRFT